MISSHKIREQNNADSDALPITAGRGYDHEEYPPNSKIHKQFRENWDYIITVLNDSIPEQGEKIENLVIENKPYEIDLGWP